MTVTNLAPAIAASLALLPPVLAAEALATDRGRHHRRSHALRRVAGHAAADAGAPGWLVAPAERLVMMLPGQAGRLLGPGFLVDVLGALCRIEPILAERAAGHVLAHPGAYDADTVLIPALLQLTTQPPQPAVERLRAATLAHLQARIAEPLAPPADWWREARLPCSCEDWLSIITIAALRTSPFTEFPRKNFPTFFGRCRRKGSESEHVRNQ